MGEFIKDRLPDSQSYFESEDVHLVGPGRWKTGPCRFHGGSDSLRVNTQSGGWVCMACDVKGGDVLAYQMQMHNMEFVEAATALGAYADDGKRYSGRTTAATLSARETVELAIHELQRIFIVISDVRSGLIPNDADWQRFIDGARRIEALMTERAA